MARRGDPTSGTTTTASQRQQRNKKKQKTPTKRRSGGGGGGGGGGRNRNASSFSSSLSSTSKFKKRPQQSKRGNRNLVGTTISSNASARRPHLSTRGGPSRRRQQQHHQQQGGAVIRGSTSSRRDVKLPTSTAASASLPVLGFGSAGKNSIHRSWLQPLGGLIRYYVNLKLNNNNNNNNNPATAAASSTTSQRQIRDIESEIEQLYFYNDCSVEMTRDAIIQAIAKMSPPNKKQQQQQQDSVMTTNANGSNPWVTLTMVVERQQFTREQQQHILDQQYETSCDGKGFRLKVVDRPGEGVAHAGETWKTILVPDWAVGKAYYYEVNNRSPLGLGCEMSVDESKVAKNAPTPAWGKSTIRPDNQRYFQSHQWVFQPAQRVKLLSQQQLLSSIKTEEDVMTRRSKRYNGIRPNYHGQRVSLTLYPDPTTMGWTFTGSVEASKVEFFEKKVNMGIVRMDFFYTTATVKTVLDHPRTGINQLFRRCKASPDTYHQILQNPRFHSGLGYRRSSNQSAAPNDTVTNSTADMDVDDTSSVDTTMDEDKDNSTGAMIKHEIEAAAAAAAAANSSNDGVTPTATYFAKNDTYDFELGGHANRKSAMQHLQPTAEFRAWEEASRKDWACVHAKFYVSMQRFRYIGNNNNHNNNAGHGPNRNNRKGRDASSVELEPLPETAHIVDIKAAEQASLATKFHATGDAPMSTMVNQQQPRKPGNLKMARIAGLKDSPEWGTGPVFELKLFYRAEQHQRNEDIDTKMDDDDDGSEDDDTALVDRLRDNTPLGEYKAGRLLQLIQWHKEVEDLFNENNRASNNNEEAEIMFGTCRGSILDSHNTKSVDDSMKVYFDWHQKQQWRKKE